MVKAGWGILVNPLPDLQQAREVLVRRTYVAGTGLRIERMVAGEREKDRDVVTYVRLMLKDIQMGPGFEEKFSIKTKPLFSKSSTPRGRIFPHPST